MKTSLVLIGGGGHCRACIDIIEMISSFEIVEILDLTSKLGDIISGEYKITATDDDIQRINNSRKVSFLITLGQIESPKRRIEIFQALKEIKADIATVISPLAYVSKHASIGKGNIIMHHACVNAGAQISDNCIINTKALIEHDVKVHSHCHVSTGAIINGGAEIGAGSFIGSNATIVQNVKVKENSFVKAGTLVKS